MRLHRLRPVLKALLLGRRCGQFLATVSLLPVLILAPLGAGTIVIHDHHDEDLHTHRAIGYGMTGQAGVATLPLDGHEHDHETGEGAQLVLVTPDLSRVMTCAASSLKLGTTQTPANLSCTPSIVLATEKPNPPAGSAYAHQPPRADGGLAYLLMTTNAILI